MRYLNILLSVVFLTSISLASKAQQEANKLENYTQKIDGTNLSFTMQAIPGGSFTMGSENGNSDEKPTHQVQLDPFWMSTFEVTWDLFEPFLYKDYELSSSTEPLSPEVDAVTRPTKPYLDMTFGMGKLNHPALAMTHYSAIQFCKWIYARTGVFYRLPTEAEWEYAARAGSSTEYFFGAKADELGEYAWFNENSEEKTHEVGQKKANPWGLHDIYGNAAEWTYDQYYEDYSAFSGLDNINPIAEPTALYPHSVRGGSYLDEAQDLRSASRLASDPSWKQIDPQIPKSNWWFPDAPFVGIRLVRPAVQPPKEEIEAYYDKEPILDF